MKQTLQVRLSQHLALTPQLQQSIRLLQLSTLELHQEVEQMLDENPFLERPDEDTSGFEASLLRAQGEAPSSAERAGESEESGGAAGDTPPDALDDVAGATEREDWANGTEGDDFDGIADWSGAVGTGAADSDEEAPDAGQRTGGATTLAEHLHAQAAGLPLGPEDAAALAYLIGSLDDDGYLTDTLDELANALLGVDEAGAGCKDEDAEEGGEGEPSPRASLMSRLRCARGWLQSFDPPGVGASSLGECLSLQLRRELDDAHEPVSDAASREALHLAVRICTEAGAYLDSVGRRDWRKLSSLLGVSEEAVRAAVARITRCEPKPGRPWGGATAVVVIPDVIVQPAPRRAGAWRVVVNPEVMPRLRINEFYAQALSEGRGKSARGAGASPLGARLQEARWFMKNIQQRFDTIVRVSQAIIERQHNFLTHGEIAMKPLVLREIADELGLHESTISRVTTNKYMATPRGTYELKYFFGSSLNTDAGGNASSTAVRALLKQLVAAEDARKPLSDSALSQMLEEQGIQVARRTVAKYRESLRIAPASLRKALT